MKKIICFILLFSLFVASPQALAQTSKPSSARQVTTSSVPNVMFAKSVAGLMARLKAAVARADKISQRIVTRLAKLRLNNQATIGKEKLTAFDAQQKAFAINLEQAKIDLVQFDLASQSFNTSSSPKKDYLAFKNQVLTFIKNIRDVYKLELDLVTDIKQIASVAAVPSGKVAPTQ